MRGWGLGGGGMEETNVPIYQLYFEIWPATLNQPISFLQTEELQRKIVALIWLSICDLAGQDRQPTVEQHC